MTTDFRTAAGVLPALMSARGIDKRFGATHALKMVDFDIRAGEVHALVGANGAGKSTLARTLAGMQRPDQGTIAINGNETVFARPRDALQAGVSMVTQETSLAPALTAIENIFLPELAKPGKLDWKSLRQFARDLIDDLKIDIGFSLDARVADLSMANRQLVEILKVLALDSKIIFLDEPTTSLSPYECDKLLELTQNLARKGHGLVLVTHRMEEIFSFTDTLTVLREGALIASSVPTSSVDTHGLIQLMVGRELRDVYGEQNRQDSFPETVFEIDRLKLGAFVRDVSFNVGKGEIVGLGGLIGAGRTETLEAIFGLEPAWTGEMRLFGKPFHPQSPIEAIRAGFGFVGEDRRRHGLIPDFSVRENLMLTHLSLQKGFGLNYSHFEAEANAVVESLGLKASRLSDANILKFSGGMQQKIIIARWLLSHPKILILDEPTRGVDIETRASIYKALRELAIKGTSIIVVSSDFEELLGISDRVIVLSDGRSVANVPALYLDIERLTMLAAPRSSAGQINVVLQTLASDYTASAVWIHLDGEDVFCFDSAHHPNVPSAMPRGAFARRDQTPFAISARSDDAWSLLVPLHGKRGQVLGHIGITVPQNVAVPSEPELIAAIQRGLNASIAEAA